jgi:hypothetical protein
MENSTPSDPKDSVDRGLLNRLEPALQTVPKKTLDRLISIVGQETIDECQQISVEISTLEEKAQANGRIIVQQICWLVEKVEAADIQLRLQGISQKAVSKQSLIKALTYRSKDSYYRKYFPIWEHREYLWDEQTESPTSIRHALRIINNHLSAEKRGETMSQSIRTKSALLDQIKTLQEENELLREQNKQLQEKNKQDREESKLARALLKEQNELLLKENKVLQEQVAGYAKALEIAQAAIAKLQADLALANKRLDELF